jgi:hypothetical protein
MSEKENPARRLYEVLHQMRREPGGTTGLVLAQALGIDVQPLNMLVEAALEFYSLFDDTIHCLHKIEGINEELYIKPIEELRQAIPITQLNDPWQHYLSHVSDVNMRSLQHIIHELDRQPLPPAVKPETLDEFARDVNELYLRMADSDLPPEIRSLILERLYDIIKAIRLFSARGTQPLRRALLLNAGTLFTNWHLFEQYKEEEEVKKYKSVFMRLWEIIPTAADTTTLISAGWNAVKALLSGGES